MTACTSFVAVDTEVSNATGQSTPMRVPVEMPEGVTYEGVFGSAAAQAALGVRSGAPAAPMMESMRRLGYLGTVPKANGDLVRGQAMKPSKRAPLPSFTTPMAAHRDGSQIIVESDGEIWTRSARGRTLRRRLAAAEIDALRATIASARPDDWSGQGSGERLVLDVPGRQYVVGLPSRDPAINGLVDMVERWAS